MTEKPDVTVAIDLGTTFTGVGLLFPGGRIHVLDNWPGNNQQSERKAPTRLVYNHDSTVSSWGFQCDVIDPTLLPGKTDRRLFKIFLDQATQEEAIQGGLTDGLPSRAEAAKCITDYLREIYRHVKNTYQAMTGIQNWTNSSVQFIFSVPTTWKGMDVINTFKAIIRDAGFGTEGVRHSAQIDLTEAEAAAVDTLKSGVVKFGAGDIFLTVDAGGGTTDLSLVRVTSVDDGIPQISQIAEVSGIGTGSTLIDSAFEALVEQRLAANPDVPYIYLDGLAKRMMRSDRFRITKHLIGEPLSLAQVHRVPMPNVPHQFSHDGLRAEGACMLFDNDEIQALFDPHVESIIAKIQEQLDWMVENQCNEQVTRMILSGGLGSSAYVQQRIKRHFTQFNHPNARHVSVIASANPQTTVVRGLLQDHKQRMETGNKPVLATYIARASYGVVVRELYSPERHYNEEIKQDEHDPSQSWAVNQIQWVIRKGDSVDPNEPLVKQFVIRLDPGQTTRSWNSQIVISRNEPDVLPRSLRQAGVKILCQVKSNLTGIQQHELVLKKKRGSCFSKGYTYYNCVFDVRVIVAPADLRFELWFGGQKFSRNHDPVQVEWN